MPWNNQGGQGGSGGPWGGGSGGGQGGGSGGGGRKSPWGGGSQPPDFDAVIRRGQDWLARLLPGRGGARGLWLVLFAALALWFASGFYRVQPDEQGVVLRFGEWVRTTQPGLNYHLPSPIETVLTPKVTRVNRVEVGFRSGADGLRGSASALFPEEALMLTGDENIVDVNFTVFWIIKDAGEFLFNVRDPETMIKSISESAMRFVIGQTPIQLALAEGRSKIETDSRAYLQAALDARQAGMEITQLQLQKVDPPGPVIDAFRDVQRARADLERLRNEAEAYRNDIIPKARGDAERIVQGAEAYKQEVVARATGDADRFMSVLKAYRRGEDVTVQRIYIETLEEILSKTKKIFIDPAASKGGQGVIPYLPLPALDQGRKSDQGAAK